MRMRRRGWIVHGLGLLMVECFIVCCALGESVANQKAESSSATPIPTYSPPEGNATFVDGATWCVALPGVSEADLKNSLDWACGLGATDCSAVQPGAPCFQPDTLLSHASYAFNTYYQVNGNSDIACNFGGTATITKNNPSYGSCQYASSEPSSAFSILGQRSLALKILAILIMLCVKFVV